MATWKKVLVSGSDINVAEITSSNLPGGTSADKVIVVGADGGFKQVAQSLIQGTTEATFGITGSTVTNNDSFDGTADSLIFDGSNGLTTTVSTPSAGNTLVTINLPDGTISGSSQVDITATDGYSSFSSSLAADIATNASNIASNDTDISNLQQEVDDLQLTASALTVASGAIAANYTALSSSVDTTFSSITALNLLTGSLIAADDTGSFVISSSVSGTANEITVEQGDAGLQGLVIGLPNDVTVSGEVVAESFVFTGLAPNDATVATVEGSTDFGTLLTDQHQFTGSLNVTGSFVIDNNPGDIIFRQNLGNDTARPTDILVRDNADGSIKKGGAAIEAAISGAFDAISASIATDIAAIDVSTVNSNEAEITALQNTSQSLLDSASIGINFDASNGNTSIALGQSASFIATGSGLTVAHSQDSEANVAITYEINPDAVALAAGAFTGSSQVTNILDSQYIQFSDAPISGAQQLQDLGFLTSSNFGDLAGTPSGLISASATGDNQGQIKLNGNNVTIKDLDTGGSPTFNNVTVKGNLTVSDPGSTANLNVEQLNIEDQFILLNSGALDTSTNEDKDGGFIVDNGNGQGALFYYDFTNKNWGFRGATDDNKVSWNAESGDAGSAMVGEVFVATVSSSAVNPNNAVAPKYGAGAYAKGQMHINTADDTIWIYV